MLEAEGYEVALARSGAEALERLEADSFDGIFTDIGMPGMSGWELARAVRERSATMPLAVITGWGDAVGLDEQEAAQVDWVVTKPFTAERIAELARGVARRREEVVGVLTGRAEAGRPPLAYAPPALAAAAAAGLSYSSN
jgi:CheY-like chemotaxis protein